MVNRLLLNTALAILLAISTYQGIAYAENQQKQGGTIIYTKPLKAVTFSHDSHSNKQGLTCNLCHTRIFKMQALAVQDKADFTMAGLSEGKYCGACHNGTMAFTSNSRCASCHTGVKGLPQEKKNQHRGKAGH